MAYATTELANEQAGIKSMNTGLDRPDQNEPERGGAEFGEEGSGATSGYGDTTEDDLTDHLKDEEEDPLDVDADEALRGDDLDNDDDL